MENTSLNVLCKLEIWDHLHIRGEYSSSALSCFSLIGSPPHTWRIQVDVVRLNLMNRITSTYVENTNTTSIQPIGNQDHLHIRGEYLMLRGMPMVRLGSPPHTWRIHISLVDLKISSGITSTYVENTLSYANPIF